MIVFKKIEPLQDHLQKQTKNGLTIGFVPTMGALHQGHLSLIEQSRKNANITVASIFVNPTQFNDVIDFEKYPSTIEKDLVLLEKSGCDIVFLPSVSEMYPAGLQSATHYPLGAIENILEGEYRPGHFQGVAQVVHRLLLIVDPDFIIIGQKDYQQCMVIKQLATITGSRVQVITGNTYRETSGLAMSSRNLRLSPSSRHLATAIFKMLTYIKDHFHQQSITELQRYATAYLLENGFDKVDYVAIANAATLLPFADDEGANAVVLIAATIGDVRLIDNMLISQ